MVNFSNIKINKKDNSKNYQDQFQLTDEKIAIINKTAEYMTAIGDFVDWCHKNPTGDNIKQGYLICEDFVKSNQHIIDKIKRSDRR